MVGKDSDRCEICGSAEEIALYQLDGEVVTRCERHAVGIALSAENSYWKRESIKRKRENE